MKHSRVEETFTVHQIQKIGPDWAYSILIIHIFSYQFFYQAQLDVVPTAECNLLWVRAIVGGLIKGTPGSQARIHHQSIFSLNSSIGQV